MPASVRHVNAVHVSSCTAYMLFPFILGTRTVKDSSSPCCNAACQLGSLVYTGSRSLPFPHLFKSSALARVSTSVIRCKEACGTEVTWLSHRMGFPPSRWPRTRHTTLAARTRPVENPLSDRQGAFVTLGKRLCSDPGAVVPLLSDFFAFPLPRVGGHCHSSRSYFGAVWK